MMIDLLKDQLTNYAYDAQLAGLNYSLKNDSYAVNLEVDGYNEKHEQFVLKLVDELMNFNQFESERFEVLSAILLISFHYILHFLRLFSG